MDELLKELRELKARGDDMIAGAEAEKRGLNDEETKTLTELRSKVDAIKAKISAEEFRSAVGQATDAVGQIKPKSEPVSDADREYRSVLRKYLAGQVPLSEVRALGEKLETRAATTSNVEAVIPQSIETQVIKVLERFIMRRLATVQTFPTDRVIPVVADVGAASYIGEGGTFPVNDDTFGKVNLTAFKVGKITKITEELIKDSAIDIWPQFIENIGMAIGRADEASYMTGDGTGKPTGVFPSASVGHTAASATALVADDILDLVFSLDEEFDAGASILMHKDTLRAIAKLKDGNGNYLFLPNNWIGEKPGTILGKPVFTSKYAPQIATGARPVLVGDFKHYLISDRTGLFIQALWERYADEGMVGIRAFRRSDAKLTRADAIKALVMA